MEKYITDDSIKKAIKQYIENRIEEGNVEEIMSQKVHPIDSLMFCNIYEKLQPGEGVRNAFILGFINGKNYKENGGCNEKK